MLPNPSGWTGSVGAPFFNGNAELLKRNAVLSYPVKSFLHEVQQHVDRIHVHAHVLRGALLDFRDQEHVQAGKRQVPEQVDHVAEGKTGLGSDRPC